jgi:hypothetical protein
MYGARMRCSICCEICRLLREICWGLQTRCEAAFANLIEQRAGALLVGADALFSGGSVIALAARYAVPPASHESRVFAEAGGLMSYGDGPC